MDYKVIIIEDDAVFAKLQVNAVNNLENFICEEYYLNPIEFLNSKSKPDIILLDLVMPEMNGLDAILPILEKHPNVAIVINSIKDETDVILSALKQGAVGYIDKQNFFEYLEEVLESVSNGGAFMTPKIARKVFDFFQKQKNHLESLTKRETDVANGIIDGLSYKLIATRHNISLDTVRMNIRSIYKKLKINSKSELISLVAGTKTQKPSL